MNKVYESLEQRMVHTCIDTFPSFMPAEGGPGLEAQKQFHCFITKLYHLLCAKPELLACGLHEDDAHTNRFNAGQDHKPKLKDQMRKVLKEVDSLLSALFALGQTGQVEGNALVADETVKISRKHRVVLTELGVGMAALQGRTMLTCDEYPQLFHAWVWMATREGASLLAFSRCFFRQGHPYTAEIFSRLLGEEPFHRLETWLIEHRYTRFDNLDGMVSLDYANVHGDTTPIKGGFQYGIRHPGIAARYDLYVKQPPVIGLCIPRMKDVLVHITEMSETLQDFVVARTKHCDGCRYCVQTDKTGTRPLAFVAVHHNEKEVNLCPYFPGYHYCWTALDDDTVNNLTGMLEFINGLCCGSQGS